MKIAMINLTGGGMSGGYYSYLKEIVPWLVQSPAVEHLLCALPRGSSVPWKIEDSSKLTITSCQPYTFWGWRQDKALISALDDFRPHVIFVPTERFFRYKKVPVVHMVQNMEPLVRPTWRSSFVDRLKQTIKRRDAFRTLRQADGIIAISEFVEDFLVSRWGIAEERIGSVVYHGSPSLPIGSIRNNCIPDSWEDRFLFTTGSLRPYRGIEDVVFALPAILARNPFVAGLVIAGGTAVSSYVHELKQFIQSHHLNERVIWAGGLLPEEMRWCYSNSRLCLITSRVEACPMIALEALRFGSTIIATDNPPLPEILLNGALFYSSGDFNALADRVHILLNDSERGEEVRRNGRARAKRFSWEQTSHQTVQQLQNALHRANQ